MISSKVFSSLKNAYSKVSGNGVTSSYGGDFDDGLTFFPSCSILDFYYWYPWVVMNRAKY